MRRSLIRLGALLPCIALVQHCLLWPTTVREYRNATSSHGFLVIVHNEESHRHADLIEKLAHSRDEIRDTLFPDLELQPIGLYLYEDPADYAQSFDHFVDSIALYDSRGGYIHIPVSAPVFAYRHELVHAILQQARSDAPYWLHEGLAYFAMQSLPTAPIRCEAPQPHRLPTRLYPYIRELRSRSIEPENLFSTSSDARFDVRRVIASAFFVFFLYERGELMNLLEAARKNPEQDVLYALTRADLNERNRLVRAFNEWLNTDAPLQARPGC